MVARKQQKTLGGYFILPHPVAAAAAAAAAVVWGINSKHHFVRSLKLVWQCHDENYD